MPGRRKRRSRGRLEQRPAADMTLFGAPELLSDFSDFGRPHTLREALAGPGQYLSSPDGRHLFVLQDGKLLSFPRLAAPLYPASYLDKTWPPHQPAPAGLTFPRSRDQSWVLALVWESGRAEVWSPPTPSGATGSRGWALLRTLELCNSPRARVVSVCSCGEELVWCEERLPSEAKLLPSSGSHPFSYCVCQRGLEVQGEQVRLGGMKVVLHHSPLYHVLSSPQHVFMMPGTPSSACQLLLIYCPGEDTVTITSTSTGLLHSKSLSEGGSDFKKMAVECLGCLSLQATAGSRGLGVTVSGELLLMDTKGGVHLLYPGGAVRHIYDFDNWSISPEAEVRMQIFRGTLACVLDTVLYLVDTNTGRLMEQKMLNADELFFLKLLETDDIQFLTKTGIYKISYSGSSGCAGGVEDNGKSEPALLEMVFEEACKYYQKRSLSSTKLTVTALKKEGMFQAPIILSSILNSYQKDKKSNDLHKKYTNLLNTMSSELQSYSSLELLKSSIINASKKATEQYCEDLVDQEINRLLHTDLDKEHLVYMNSLFSIFPKPVWMSLKRNLQFQQNGDGKLVLRATSDMWKKVLGPLPSGSRESSLNGVVPLFEVICQSLYMFKPKWLPRFVQQAQECAVLSWNFSSKDNCEGAPLYKRALSVLSKDNTTDDRDSDLEIDLLLSSRRPQAVIQAIHILISLQQWERVMRETQNFSQLSPIISKDIFITLLVEFVKHRHLDSYINQLCDICPEDMTATDILRIVLQNMPKTSEDQPLFSCNSGVHLTVGLLKPLLNKVLQNQSRHDEVHIAPYSPSSTPQRTILKAVADPVFVNGDGLMPNTSSLTDIYATNAM
ncbi:hypothetical protein FKM82_014510 [Ascaphus truei]